MTSSPRRSGRQTSARQTSGRQTSGRQTSGRPLINWHRAATANLSPGERAADRLRNGMGSWTFVGAFLAAMGVWAVLNSVGFRWDPYPFILLNLFLSMLAGLQGAILLIAAKRQDAIAAALSQHDYDTNVAAKAEIEELMEINRAQLELLRELRRDFPAAPAPLQQTSLHPTALHPMAQSPEISLVLR